MAGDRLHGRDRQGRADVRAAVVSDDAGRTTDAGRNRRDDREARGSTEKLEKRRFLLVLQYLHPSHLVGSAGSSGTLAISAECPYVTAAGC